MENIKELFKNKELVRTFDYSTSTKDRQVCTSVSFNGRKYIKFGTLQAVTMIGAMYKTDENKNMLVIGISKQHPSDNMNKSLGYEIAHLNMLSNPSIIMNVDKTFKQRDFNKLCKAYIDSMDLAFVQTAKEKNILENGGIIV